MYIRVWFKAPTCYLEPSTKSKRKQNLEVFVGCLFVVLVTLRTSFFFFFSEILIILTFFLIGV